MKLEAYREIREWIQTFILVIVVIIIMAEQELKEKIEKLERELLPIWRA